MAASAVQTLLMEPPSPEFGDIALPCFSLTRVWRKTPAVIAQELAAKVAIEPPLHAVEANGPYLNFRLDRGSATQALLQEILTLGDAWGNLSEGTGKTICIDFCSPNVAKPMHLGHLRSTVIGKSLSRIFETLGYEVVRITFPGDWGAQFGKLMVAWKLWGDPRELERDQTQELLRVYVRFHATAELDPHLEEEARSWFKRLEEGDPEAVALWEWIRTRSMEGVQRTLSLLDVSFDLCEAESGYSRKTLAVVDALSDRDLLLETSDGTCVVELDGMPPAAILRSDGTSLYLTRDIAACMHRQERFEPHRSLYVVDLGQSLHFKQLFGVIAKMGLDWARVLEHVGFGVMRVGGKRLRTREGEIIYLDDVLRQAISAAERELEVRSPNMANAREVATAIGVGVGAVIFNDLKHQRQHDIDFELEDALSFEGETGPYVQYAHARCQGILRRVAPEQISPPVIHPCFGGDYEWALTTAIAELPYVIADAGRRCEPHLVARAVLDIAKAFSRFYHECPVIQADEGVREARLALVATTAIALRKGLWVLGLETPPMRA
jgi:arginyl-tRNA synthetase